MDFQSAMETFAEAWVAANAAGQQTQALALTRPKSPCIKKERSPSPPPNRSSSGHSSPTHPNKNLSGHQSSLKTSPIPIVNENGLAPSSCRNTPIPLAMTPKINENGLHHQHHQQPQPQHSDKILQSPSIDRRDFDMSKVNSKSLPLHCVVESVHSLQASLNIDSRSPFKRRPTIETDSYVIIAASTQWSDIVSTALQKLGYSNEVANTARGSLIIKNWKPISLENICENPVVQVSEILGELTTIVTLRIVILRSKTTPFSEIKDKLLKLLVLQSHAVLRSTGCPLDEVTLSQICRSPYQNTYSYPGCEISEDTKRKFDQWWNTQLSPQAQLTSKILPFITPPSGGQHDEMEFSSQAAAAAAAAHAIASHHQAGLENHHHHPNQSAVPTTPTHPNPMLVHPALHSMHSHHHHHSGQFGNQKTRMRTSFDPEMELPKLQKWFQENPHPSRQQIQTYVVQLNSLESRRGRKPLDVNNVVYWFKNARAAQKRAEIRGGLGGNGYFPHPQSQQNQQHHQSSQHVNNTMHMSTHDFLKSPISLKSEDIDDNISQHSDDLDEDNSCSRPSSPPQLPLSLTIHERNRSEDDSSVKDELSVNGGHEGITEMSSSKNDIGSMNTNSSCHNSTHEDEVSRCGDNENVNTHNQDGEHNLDEHNNNNSSNNNNNVDEKSNENSPKNSSKSEEDLDMDEDNNSQMMDDGYRSPSPDPRRELPFPMVPNSMLQHSFMYMSHYMPGAMAAAQAPHHPHNPNMTPVGVPAGLNLSNMSSEERRKRNRTFIDPVTEVPKLEQWFAMNTHPSHNLILKYTEDLNRMPYRQKFPRLESKNVQFWFKNRRAKCKRLKMSLYDGPQCSQLGGLNPYAHHKYEERD